MPNWSLHRHSAGSSTTITAEQSKHTKAQSKYRLSCNHSIIGTMISDYDYDFNTSLTQLELHSHPATTKPLCKRDESLWLIISLFCSSAQRRYGRTQHHLIVKPLLAPHITWPDKNTLELSLFQKSLWENLKLLDWWGRVGVWKTACIVSHFTHMHTNAHTHRRPLMMLLMYSSRVSQCYCTYVCMPCVHCQFDYSVFCGMYKRVLYTHVLSTAVMIAGLSSLQIQETALLLAAQMVSQGVSMETSEMADEVSYMGCCAYMCLCMVAVEYFKGSWYVRMYVIVTHRAAADTLWNIYCAFCTHVYCAFCTHVTVLYVHTSVPMYVCMFLCFMCLRSTS